MCRTPRGGGRGRSLLEADWSGVAPASLFARSERGSMIEIDKRRASSPVKIVHRAGRCGGQFARLVGARQARCSLV